MVAAAAAAAARVCAPPRRHFQLLRGNIAQEGDDSPAFLFRLCARVGGWVGGWVSLSVSGSRGMCVCVSGGWGVGGNFCFRRWLVRVTEGVYKILLHTIPNGVKL